MNWDEIKEFTEDMFAEYGLSHVRFEWNRSKQNVGLAYSKRIDGHYRGTRITLSKPLISAMDNDLRQEALYDVIMHEIAHVLANERYNQNCGHDYRWRGMARKIGARDETKCMSGAINSQKIQHKYTASCGNGCTYHFDKMGRHWRNGSYCCRGHAKRLTIVQNY